MQYGLIGERLGHSFSKDIHEKQGGYPYELCEVEATDIDAFMQKRDFKAINVTIPYKESVLPYLDYTDENARRIGAVNTIVNKDGALYGYNTDYHGLKALINKADICLKGKKVLILGTGGTSKTAQCVAKDMGAETVIKVSRTKKENCITYNDAYSLHADTDVIINTTPCGMYPNIYDTPVDIDMFPSLSGVVDVIYNPIRTRLVSNALKKGIKATGGLYMLVSQAVFASEKFVDRVYSEGTVHKAFNELVAEKENIVLIGMPSSGKSTLGKIIADLTGREFVDTDKIIEKTQNMKIPDIFSKHGEQFFRDLETECVKEVSKKNGCVIATGGGAILRSENADALYKNGRMYFLDRPVDALCPTSDRPLSKDTDAIKKRFEERYPIYLSLANETVKIDKSASEIAKHIIKLHEKRKSKHMKVQIEKSKANGIITAPPSKSMAHRLLICSGLSLGTSVVKGIAFSEDVLATLDCLKALGATYSVSEDTVTITGVDLKTVKSAKLNCRESGSTLRFFIPLCLMSGESFSLSGSETLLKRPLSVYEEICESQGLDFENTSSCINVGGILKPGNYKVKGNISSQFISGLLFALPLLNGDSTISITPPIESCSYINLTISALAQFGVKISWADERTLYIKGNQKYTPQNVTVEGDYSNAAFFSALNFLGGDVKVCGLNEDSLQGDKVYGKLFDMIERGTPTIHISNCPDLGPVLFALAACKNGGVFTGTARLKIKESDRANAMAEELKKFGVSVKVDEDSVVVYPATFHAPGEALNGHNDHRIVMALSTMLTLTGGEIKGAEAVSKSMPDFFEKLRSLNVEVTEHADN